MNRSTLIEEAQRVFQQPLSDLGYLLESEPPVRQFEFWFEKRPSTRGDMYRIVEFQLSGFGREELFATAVNLARRPYRDFDDERNYRRPKSPAIFEVRLAPRLWETAIEEKAMDQWWHFDDSIDELRVAYADTLEKLLKYGIPFLENPNSTWWSWAGMEPQPERA